MAVPIQSGRCKDELMSMMQVVLNHVWNLPGWVPRFYVEESSADPPGVVRIGLESSSSRWPSPVKRYEQKFSLNELGLRADRVVGLLKDMAGVFLRECRRAEDEYLQKGARGPVGPQLIPVGEYFKGLDLASALYPRNPVYHDKVAEAEREVDEMTDEERMESVRKIADGS